MLASWVPGQRLAVLVALVGAATAGACGGSDFSSAGGGGAAGNDGGATGGAGGSAAGAGGSAGAAGSVSDGGTDGPCTDADGDGVTTCQGDCDDNDRNTYPGAPEICGDGRNNGCTGGLPDQGCGGLGTFVSAKVGTPGGTGTMTDPVDTIGHGMTNAQKILQANPSMKRIAVYVADGHYPEKIVMAEGTSLLGGFSCETSTNCTWKRDPKSFDSAILDQDDGGLVVPASVTRQTVLDGFSVQGHDTTQPQYQPGAVAITIAGGSPTISNNTINGPTLSSGGNTSNSIGIAISGSTTGSAIQKPGPLVIANSIYSGQATNTSVGVQLGAPRAFNWSAGKPPPGTVAEIKQNTIYGGKASSCSGIAAFTSTDGTIAVGNIIGAGQANSESWGISFSSVLAIDANRINANSNQVAKCGSSTAWCGGIVSHSGEGVITNNIVYGADGQHSTALRLAQVEAKAQEVVVSSNLLVGAPPAGANVTAPTAAVVELDNPGCNGCAVASVGRIRNNILMPGLATTRFGILEAPSTSNQDIHPEKIENNDLWFVPFGGGATDVLYEQRINQTATDLINLVGVNGLSNAAGNFSGNCLDTTFHLTGGAACIDKGISSDAPDHDFEGDKRPQGSGFDVGPDEAP